MWRLSFGPIFHHGDHRAHLAGRSSGNRDEGLQFICRGPLETFGDIVRHGERRAVKLIAKAWRERHAGFFEKIEVVSVLGIDTLMKRYAEWLPFARYGGGGTTNTLMCCWSELARSLILSWSGAVLLG